MDFESHKKLADNALIKTQSLLEEYNTNKSVAFDLLNFAHTARLHYDFTTFDKTDKEYLNSIKKADEILIKVCEKLGLNETITLINKSKIY